MNLETHEDVVRDRMRDAADEAVDDDLAVAKSIADRHRRTGRFSGSLGRTELLEVSPGRLEARIGSTLVSAKAKEKGAFITAKRGKYLVFKVAGGVRKVESVRLAPQPVVTPAGARWPRLVAARLVDSFR